MIQSGSYLYREGWFPSRMVLKVKPELIEGVSQVAVCVTSIQAERGVPAKTQARACSVYFRKNKNYCGYSQVRQSENLPCRK